MEIHVYIEPVAGNGYQAAALGLTARGASEQEALANLKTILAERTAAGARVVTLEYLRPPDTRNNGSDPWTQMQGVFKDDPLFEEWQKEIEAYRQERDGADDQ